MPETVIPLSMTWGEWANVYRRLAESGEVKALAAMRPDLARVAASAEALNSIIRDLPDDLKQRVAKTLEIELGKQGF